MISLDHIRDAIPKEEYSSFAGWILFLTALTHDRNLLSFSDPHTDEHQRVVRMRELIEKLAPKYRSTLKFFVEHLKRSRHK